jgi:pyruvate,orthophosphate dikinase
MGIDDDAFDAVLSEVKRRCGASSDVDLDKRALRQLVDRYLAICRERTGEPFPHDPYEQLERAIAAVFRSWNGKRAVDYRRQFRITSAMANGTAVNIVAMVFGNMGADSATGVGFTRNPATGENVLYGEYLTDAQGEDVVAGIRTPKPISELAREMPQMYRQLVELRDRLEAHYKEVQDFEFTIERGKLYCLQTRNGKMNARAMVVTSVEMAKSGAISKARALNRIEPALLDQLLVPALDPAHRGEPLARGLPASPGAASGRVVFDADTAEQRAASGEKVVLVREETKPEDIHGFFAAQGILTARGGKTSHAAVVARGMGKPCVSGCERIVIDVRARRARIGDAVLGEGDFVTIDGTTGNVYAGQIPTVEADFFGELATLLEWADDVATLRVLANADTPNDARRARRYGAVGIGLCRTERMFNDPKRLPIVQQMILADSVDVRRTALAKLLPIQRADFKALFAEMAGLPVTVRLLDPPMHEFLPSASQLEFEISQLCDNAQVAERAALLKKVRLLSEVNPMLGHRGVRLGITFPEIYEMQIRAILEAAAQCMHEGIEAHPEIMVPQVCDAEELRRVRILIDNIRADVEARNGVKLRFKFGSMMEVVRACLTAPRIAEVAEFFSFGTNDLTQATFSFSREDAENKFLPQYVANGVLPDDPFEALDANGVGRLIKLAVEEGRGARSDLVIGICGEHGGHAESIAFCHDVGLDYVSCSAPRVPIARLAAAQAKLREPNAAPEVRFAQARESV